MNYVSLVDKWSSLHLIGGWLLTIILYSFFKSTTPVYIIAPMLIVTWEILENIAIKPKLFPHSPVESKKDMLGDIVWSLLGVVFFSLTLLVQL